MNRFLIVYGFAMLLSATATADPPSKQSDSEAVPSDQSKHIPLNEVVTTGPIPNLCHFDDVFPKESQDGQTGTANDYLRKFKVVSNGASNVFLVDAANAQDAISASVGVFFGGRPVDVPAPVNKPNPATGSHWLVAYLGLGPSEPTWWNVESIEVSGGKVRLSYRTPPPSSPVTSDVHAYYFWVPLGTLEPNSYRLELCDSVSGVVTLMRRVDVKPTNTEGRAK